MDEKALQKMCEQWLTIRGYCRLTADNAASDEPKKGWFGHLVEAKRNPLMPDLFILNFEMNKPPLMIELKVRDKWQPGQREMVKIGAWKLAWSFQDVEKYVKSWELA